MTLVVTLLVVGIVGIVVGCAAPEGPLQRLGFAVATLAAVCIPLVIVILVTAALLRNVA